MERKIIRNFLIIFSSGFFTTLGINMVTQKIIVVDFNMCQFGLESAVVYLIIVFASVLYHSKKYKNVLVLAVLGTITCFLFNSTNLMEDTSKLQTLLIVLKLSLEAHDTRYAIPIGMMSIYYFIIAFIGVKNGKEWKKCSV